MTIRLHDGTGFKTKAGSNILVRQPEPDRIEIHWVSETNIPCSVLANKVRQIEAS